MKVGSLVECIYHFVPDPMEVGYGIKYPVCGEIYTVRDVIDCSEGIGVVLEEIINPVVPFKTGPDCEMYFTIDAFREVQPPMSLKFIEELQFENA